MITASQSITWAIAGPGPTPQISGSRSVEWSILSSDPVPASDITGSVSVTWVIWGQDAVELVLLDADTGMIGVLTIMIEDSHGNLLYGPTTGGITEEPPGSGRYVALIPSFTPGTYFATWSDGTTSVTVEVVFLQSGFVETFVHIRPPARVDGTPWTSVAVMEGPSRRGPYDELETITLDPVDTDPASPSARSITTGLATRTAGWYALAWTDDEGHQSMSDPEFLSAVIETVS